ncbi:PTS sugar transporter subunit IIA [Acerihabitans sp. KWT182]|uniref:PTS sugar transporter subunit IIA n=1 Tax=Acerihabitans sp. KWT182 TaxID=3157919 RepID=A0AAU7Q6G7_9GAMM
MLNTWLTDETILLTDRVDDWRQAVAQVAAPLLANHIIDAGYVDAIYRQHQALGPYYVLAPGIAMPHARPEEGARSLGLSLLLIRQGVCFLSSDNDPVYLVVMLSAPDNNSHVELIAELAELFSCEQDIQAIRQATTIEEIKKIIAHY